MWLKIKKKQIKEVPVGTKVKIDDLETTITNHYGDGDYGFDTKHEIDGIDIFSDYMWKVCDVYVWVDFNQKNIANNVTLNIDEDDIYQIILNKLKDDCYLY